LVFARDAEPYRLLKHFRQRRSRRLMKLGARSSLPQYRHTSFLAFGLCSGFFTGARPDLAFTAPVFLTLSNFALSIFTISFSRNGWRWMFALARRRSER
jgi:hypothetical protein